MRADRNICCFADEICNLQIFAHEIPTVTMLAPSYSRGSKVWMSDEFTFTILSQNCRMWHLSHHLQFTSELALKVEKMHEMKEENKFEDEK